MKAVTGREIVYDMMQIGVSIASWNKRHASMEKVVARMKELGVTQHQVEIMGFMHKNPELNTISALSSELFISKGSLSLMLSKLQLMGYIQKKAAKGEDDGRKVYVSLTKEGEDALQEVLELLLGHGATVFDEMDPEMRFLFYTKVKELKELFNIGGWKE